MKLELAHYQQQISDFIVLNNSAFILAGMGLGKTAATCHGLLRLGGRSLIVAPKRVAILTWTNEIAKWDELSGLKPLILRNIKDWNVLKDPKYNLYTINYEQLPKLAEVMDADSTLKMFDTIVYDETTRAKSHKSTRIKAWRKFSDKFTNTRRIGLTGTPMPNGALELWGQVAILDLGKRLSKSFYAYRNAYFTSDYMGYEWTLRVGMDKVIQDRIKDITITLRSEDYLDIQDTIVNDIECTLPKEAEKTYKEFERDLLATLNGTEVIAANRAVLAGKLLQVTGGSVYDENHVPIFIHDGKVKALKALTDTITEPVLIMVAYQHEYALLRTILPHSTVFGEEDPTVVLDKWNKGLIKHLISHPASCGHGLNLQEGGARQIIWFSFNWSHELYQQANARLARRGQVNQPIIHRLITTNTIDEAIVETLRERGLQQDGLLQTLKNLQALRLGT